MVAYRARPLPELGPSARGVLIVPATDVVTVRDWFRAMRAAEWRRQVEAYLVACTPCTKLVGGRVLLPPRYVWTPDGRYFVDLELWRDWLARHS